MKMQGGGLSVSADGPDRTSLGFNLLGKFPIDLGILTLYPMAGISYNMVLSMKQTVSGITYEGKRSEFIEENLLDQFSILAGAGILFPFSGNLALKGDLLLRLAFPNKLQTDDAKNYIGDATVGFGPQIRLGLAFTF